MKVQLTCKECGTFYYRTPSAAQKSNYCSNACRAKARGDTMLSDLTNKRFGRLLVIDRASNRGTQVRWLCKCDCGKEVTVGANALKQGRTKSCGCYHKDVSREQYTRLFRKSIEPGTRFTRLVVLSEQRLNKRGNVMYLCQCDCGKQIITSGNLLRSGMTKSCTCYSADRIRNLNRTHGLSGTKEYNHARRVKRRYSDNSWTSDMAKALFELQPVCVVCGSDKELAVDHVVPVTKGGRLLPGNAISLCKSCNSSKSNKDLSDLPTEMADKILSSAYNFLQYWKSVESVMVN